MLFNQNKKNNMAVVSAFSFLSDDLALAFLPTYSPHPQELNAHSWLYALIYKTITEQTPLNIEFISSPNEEVPHDPVLSEQMTALQTRLQRIFSGKNFNTNIKVSRPGLFDDWRIIKTWLQIQEFAKCYSKQQYPLTLLFNIIESDKTRVEELKNFFKPGIVPRTIRLNIIDTSALSEKAKHANLIQSMNLKFERAAGQDYLAQRAYDAAHRISQQTQTALEQAKECYQYRQTQKTLAFNSRKEMLAYNNEAKFYEDKIAACLLAHEHAERALLEAQKRLSQQKKILSEAATANSSNLPCEPPTSESRALSTTITGTAAPINNYSDCIEEFHQFVFRKYQYSRPSSEQYYFEFSSHIQGWQSRPQRSSSTTTNTDTNEGTALIDAASGTLPNRRKKKDCCTIL